MCKTVLKQRFSIISLIGSDKNNNSLIYLSVPIMQSNFSCLSSISWMDFITFSEDERDRWDFVFLTLSIKLISINLSVLRRIVYIWTNCRLEFYCTQRAWVICINKTVSFYFSYVIEILKQVTVLPWFQTTNLSLSLTLNTYY